MINVPLLRKTLEHIENHPEEWCQQAWRCETGMCFAGTACDLMGGVWVTTAGDYFGDRLVAGPGEAKHAFEIREPGKLPVLAISPSTRARKLLGLDEHAAHALFRGNNTLRDLRRLVAMLEEEALSEA